MKLIRWTLGLVAAVGAMSADAPAASAQSAGAATETDETLLPTTEAELNEFWAERRRVRVLQRRLYEKNGGFQTSLYAGAIPNDPFLTYLPIGLRLNYWMSEQLGFELGGAYNLEIGNSDLKTFLDDKSVTVDVLDQQVYRANMMFLWSPGYGKFSFLGTRLGHFDWNVGLGFGVVQTERVDAANRNLTETELKPEAVLGTGLNMWITQEWQVRFDYRQFVFEKVGGGVSLPSELSLAVGYLF